MSNKTIDEINEQLVNEIKKAMNSHIPKNNKNDKKSNPLPSYLVDLIKHKEKLKNKIKHQQIHEQTSRREYNQMTSIIREELEAIENKNRLISLKNMETYREL